MKKQGVRRLLSKAVRQASSAGQRVAPIAGRARDTARVQAQRARVAAGPAARAAAKYGGKERASLLGSGRHFLRTEKQRLFNNLLDPIDYAKRGIGATVDHASRALFGRKNRWGKYLHDTANAKIDLRQAKMMQHHRDALSSARSGHLALVGWPAMQGLQLIRNPYLGTAVGADMLWGMNNHGKSFLSDVIGHDNARTMRHVVNPLSTLAIKGGQRALEGPGRRYLEEQAKLYANDPAVQLQMAQRAHAGVARAWGDFQNTVKESPASPGASWYEDNLRAPLSAPVQQGIDFYKDPHPLPPMNDMQIKGSLLRLGGQNPADLLRHSGRSQYANGLNKSGRAGLFRSFARGLAPKVKRIFAPADAQYGVGQRALSAAKASILPAAALGAHSTYKNNVAPILQDFGDMYNKNLGPETTLGAATTDESYAAAQAAFMKAYRSATPAERAGYVTVPGSIWYRAQNNLPANLYGYRTRHAGRIPQGLMQQGRDLLHQKPGP